MLYFNLDVFLRRSHRTECNPLIKEISLYHFKVKLNANKFSKDSCKFVRVGERDVAYI